MNSWVVTLGVLQAVVILYLLKQMFTWAGMTWFMFITGGIIIFGLLVIAVLKADEAKK